MWYNTKEEISKCIYSLVDLNALIDERRTAHYSRKERLNTFYIFGYLYLDSCGNCGVLTKSNQYNYRSLPAVLTETEFDVEIKKLLGEDHWGVSFGFGSKTVPPTNITCAHCEEYWSIHNYDDLVVDSGETKIPTEKFVDKTLGEVKDALERKTDAIYRLTESPIRSDRFIDLSPRYPNATEDWEKRAVVNQYGWKKLEDLGLGYIVDETDTITTNVWRFYHKECYKAHIMLGAEDRFRSIFQQAGYTQHNLEPVPNEYCKDPYCCPPWFMVQTEVGIIKIGRRKRVYEMDWSKITLRKNLLGLKTNILKLFKDEDVTKGDTYIHAWSDEKAIEYLSKIRQALV